MPAISVVMPVYNAEATLEAAVESIFAQTEEDWELVAVDDGSTDGSGAFLERLAGREKRLRVLRRPHSGIAPSLEAGLTAARASLIARMDADDWSAPDRLEKQAAFLQENPGVGLVACKVRFGGCPVASAGYAVHVEWINALVEPQEMP